MMWLRLGHLHENYMKTWFSSETQKAKLSRWLSNAMAAEHKGVTLYRHSSFAPNLYQIVSNNSTALSCSPTIMDVLLWRRKVRAWLRRIQRRVCHKLRDLCTIVVVTMQSQMLPSLTNTKKFRSAQHKNRKIPAPMTTCTKHPIGGREARAHMSRMNTKEWQIVEERNCSQSLADVL